MPDENAVVLWDDLTEKALDLPSIEKRMLEMDGQIEIPVNHIFSAGVYIRQIEIPAGAIVMGKRHRVAMCNILLKGKLEVYVEEGKPPMIIEAPYIFTSQPFSKKFAHCLEEAIFLNIIPTNETDPVEIENKVIIPEQEYKALQGEDAPCHLLP
jgi:hypothetical protein